MPPAAYVQAPASEVVAGCWEPGPARPRLLNGAVHVWRADLASAGDGVLELLDARELERADRFLQPRKGELWARSRGVLRALLGRYLECDPRGIRLVVSPSGKPELARHEPLAEDAERLAPQLSFSLSHSGGLALFGFSNSGAVGVDIELSRPSLDIRSLARRALGPADSLRLNSLDPATCEREFLRAWTRREAELKCLGAGLPSSAGRRAVWTADLGVGAGAAGAVALQQSPRELRRWDWRTGVEAVATAAHGAAGAARAGS